MQKIFFLKNHPILILIKNFFFFLEFTTLEQETKVKFISWIFQLKILINFFITTL